MALQLVDRGRRYKRIRLTQNEKDDLLDRGLTPVLSSNVSAIAKSGRSLIVRFHGGATYEYPQSGNLYARMLNSGSKGKFVWRNLRKAGVPYKRINNIPMDYDKDLDRDLMQEAELKDIQQELLTIKPVRTQFEAQAMARRSETIVIRPQPKPKLVSTIVTVSLIPEITVTDIIATMLIVDSIEKLRENGE